MDKQNDIRENGAKELKGGAGDGISGAHLTDLQFYQYLRDELPPAQKQSAENHVRSCYECFAKIHPVDPKDSILNRDIVPGRVKPVKTSYKDFFKKMIQNPFFVPSIGVVIMLAMVFFSNQKKQQAPQFRYLPIELKEKGGEGLKVKIESLGKEFYAKDSFASLKEGDKLFFEVRPGIYSHVAGVNVSNDGIISIFYQGPLRKDGEQFLPGAVVLKELKEREIILVLFSHKPLAAKLIKADLRGAYERGKLRNPYTPLEYFLKQVPVDYTYKEFFIYKKKSGVYK